MKHPVVVASAIAGVTIGGTLGSLTEAEERENQGNTTLNQIAGMPGGFMSGGIKGGLIGGGVTGTAAALKHILRK